MYIASNPVRPGNLLKMYNSVCRMIERMIVYFGQVTIYEMKFNFFSACFGNLCGPCFLW
jgi:hypothetical protein